ELVLPPRRSPVGVRPAGEAVQPVAAHGRGLRPIPRGRVDRRRRARPCVPFPGPLTCLPTRVSALTGRPLSRGHLRQGGGLWTSPNRLRVSATTPPPNPLPEAERGRTMGLLPLSASGRGLGGGVLNHTPTHGFTALSTRWRTSSTSVSDCSSPAVRSLSW